MEVNTGINILVVDDHPAVRVAVKYILNAAGYDKITQAATGIDAITEVGRAAFDIVIMDLELPNIDGLQVVKRIKRIDSNTRILVLSAMMTNMYLMRCYTAGVHGFMQKNDDIEKLPLVVANIMKGFTYFPSIATDEKSDYRAGHSPISCLSDRELVVFNRLVAGKKNLEIANELFLSNKTISTYKTRIFDKLGVSNIAELIEISKGKIQ